MAEDISFIISIPTDNEGFALLKCSICGNIFMLKSSDFQSDIFFRIYCPICGMTSENYITENVLELAMKRTKNYASDILIKECKKLGRNCKNSFLQFKIEIKPEKKGNPIKLMVETLEKIKYPCCKIEAKIKPILKMSGSYCPYCGVKDYGIEQKRTEKINTQF